MMLYEPAHSTGEKVLQYMKTHSCGKKTNILKKELIYYTVIFVNKFSDNIQCTVNCLTSLFVYYYCQICSLEV